MIYFGMEPNPALSAGMTLPTGDLRLIRKLKPTKVIDNNAPETYERSPLQPRLGRGKGFATEKNAKGETVFRPCISVSGNKYSLPRTRCEVEARKAYVLELAKYGIKADWHELDDKWRNDHDG